MATRFTSGNIDSVEEFNLPKVRNLREVGEIMRAEIHSEQTDICAVLTSLFVPVKENLLELIYLFVYIQQNQGRYRI